MKTPIGFPATPLKTCLAALSVTLIAGCASLPTGPRVAVMPAVGKPLDPPELELMHALKTGALIRAAVMLGALCGEALGSEAASALDRFAKRAGLLFQVVDDILDCTASTATLGETAGKDAAAEKPTYVSLLGLAPARELAENLRTQALDALAVFDGRATRLIALTDFITHRSF